MAKTADELIASVLQELGVTAATQNPSAEDAALIYDDSTSPPTGAWVSISAYLRKIKISSWTDNSIPDEVFDPLVDYVAIRVAAKFGVQFENKAGESRMRLMALRAAVSQRYMGGSAEGQFY